MAVPEISAALRMMAISWSSLTRRMSFTFGAHVADLGGAVTPVRTFARTALSQPLTRASQAESAPTGVWIHGLVGDELDDLRVQVRDRGAASKPNARFASAGPNGTLPDLALEVLLRQKRISRGFFPKTITRTASGSRKR